MKKLTIALDVDGVVANLVQAFLDRYNYAWQDDLTYNEITEWGIEKFVKPECGRKSWAYIQDPTIYDIVQPYPGAAVIVRKLRQLGRVVFVTHAFESTAGRKLRWLREHKMLKDSADYIEAKDKSLICADYLLDDGVHNITGFKSGRAVLLDQPWNIDFPYAYRADSLMSFWYGIRNGVWR